MKGDLKVSFFSLYAFYARTGVQLDVDVPADLDQFGGDDSHGTVVRWKGLVELSHNAADGR